MTPEQIELARHALGLPNERRTSYRNHFVCGPGHRDYLNWSAMLAEGNANMHSGSLITGGDCYFFLTQAGAEAALKAGEFLSIEDFRKSMRAR